MEKSPRCSEPNPQTTMNRIWAVEKSKLFAEPLFSSTCHLIQFSVLCGCLFFLISRQLDYAMYSMVFCCCCLFTAHLFYVIIIVGSCFYEYFLMIKVFLGFCCWFFSICPSDNGAKIGMIIELPWSQTRRICLWFDPLSVENKYARRAKEVAGTILCVFFCLGHDCSVDNNRLQH